MFDKVKKTVNDAKWTINNLKSEYSSPLRVHQLKTELQKTGTLARHYQGLYYMYLRELSVANKALVKKAESIKGLRAKIARMEKAGLIDPEVKAKYDSLKAAGIIKPEPKSALSSNDYYKKDEFPFKSSFKA
jgi:hypothetical protein